MTGKVFRFLTIGCLALAGFASAEVQLPRLVSDGMVLQRNAPVKVWGWAEPGEAVTVEFRDKTYTAKADEDGDWQLIMPSLKPGGPDTLVVSGENTIKLENVLVGDVWLASGQSNMELTLARAEPAFEDLVPSINNTRIRQFEVPDRYNFKGPRQDLESGEWKPATQENIRKFSAVGYFFAAAVQASQQVPVGIINAALGGSPVEAWISEPVLKQFPEPYKEAQRFKNDELIEEITAADQERSNQWYEELNQRDKGLKDGDYAWADPALDTTSWETQSVPGFVESDAGPTGVHWLRKTFELSKELADQDALLVMGRIVDADQVFVNGKLVGETGYKYPPRRYPISAKVLRPGENVITVRLTSQRFRAGFVPGKTYELQFGDKAVDLTGQWQYKRGAVMPPLEPQTFVRWKPVGLFNGMIAPLTDYRIKGVIWYQGESNADTAETYQERFAAMIKDWRKRFGQEKLPFLFVQLANFQATTMEPRGEGWPQLREAQLQTLALPNTAMVVTIDVGEWNDIHPLDKRTVGERLAAAAGAIAYGQDISYSGPLFDEAHRKGNKMVLSFDHVGSGLKAEGDKLQGFTIAGKDGRFVPAQAKIEDDKVVVWSKQVKQPVAVRYAWSDNPSDANLYNEAGFPASPFRTDDWQK